MGNRLSKIFTKTGDTGTTGLATGDRIAKYDDRMEVLGDIDELNSSIGMLLAELDTHHSWHEPLLRVQHDCFDLGGELAMPGHQLLPESATDELENYINTINDQLPALKDFILPGGNKAAAYCHLARAICRRAERHYWRLLSNDESASSAGATYLNRLSDLLFVLARHLARENDGQEVLWQTRLRAPLSK